jgi:hypothetical protein
VAGYVLEELQRHRLVNKWDLLEKDSYTMDAYTAVREVRSSIMCRCSISR